MATKKKKEVKSDNKMHTFTVMHSEGEMVSGVKVIAHEQFKAVITDELQLKVDKGFLILDK